MADYVLSHSMPARWTIGRTPRRPCLRPLAAAALVVLSACAALERSPTRTDESPHADAQIAVQEFVDAVASGDRDRLAAILAPEYQIMRSNGVGYDRGDYLDVGAPSVRVLSPSQPVDIVATRHGDILVARYFLIVDEVIDGERVDHRAPRLTVFRKSGDAWLVIAHGNFGVPG